ncbi:hypothetical protein DRP53_03880 [candidate division WOR-3 bacterium]|uniref:Uncharacterized protein n=1 Tax=candidate division WOR-3 bacterium TaxID=2052148 RepID=A0A660SL59_UNCW3|nr:MAG: hypothetical protein DRP53_03880 [candidate division WOR-3 bacterium]
MREERKILRLLDNEEIPVPDYSLIYHRVMRKVKPSPRWPFLIPVVVLIIILSLFTRTGEITNPFIDYDVLSSYYYEYPDIEVEIDGDPYAMVLDLNQDEFHQVIDGLRKGLK